MTFCIITLSYFLMTVNKHGVDEDASRIAWCSVLPIFQVSISQLLIVPYKVVGIPYLLDRGPSILEAQMQVSRISQSCKFRSILI